MDDWQDHALSTRHMHNRNSRRASGKGRKGAVFDVRKAFGEYEVKCASWERALGDAESGEQDAALELLRLTDDGQGVLGELVLPGVLRAAVVLAASRRTLQVLTVQLSGEGPDEEDDGEDGEDNDDDEEEEEEDEDEDEENDRFSTFEKNSFRTPKFWLAWNGTLSLPASDSPPPTSPTHTRKTSHSASMALDSPPPSPTLSRTGSSFPPSKPAAPSSTPTQAEGMGYLTFAGNECRRFKGTLSCTELAWRDVAFAGFKTVNRSESDRQVMWAGRDVETGWKEGSGDGGERGARLDSRRRVVFD